MLQAQLDLCLKYKSRVVRCYPSHSTTYSLVEKANLITAVCISELILLKDRHLPSPVLSS